VKTIGVVTTLLGATVAVAAIVVGVRSAPDIQRYLKIRSM
jgi:hypothetical protein